MDLLTIFATLSVLYGTAKCSDDDSLMYKNCQDSLCQGRSDGNYGIGEAPNYFVQCVDSKAYCQHCWPTSLVFKEECNQCLYNMKDECQTTNVYVAPDRNGKTHAPCPEVCGKMGPRFSGNLADPNDSQRYVACWQGIRVGCLNCPVGLLFNEQEKACLFEGKYFTEPMKN